MATKKKVTAKKSAPRKTVAKTKKSVTNKSFRVAREPYPFITYKITDQTIYWTVLLILILLLGVWVVNIQISISDILDSIPVTT